MDDHQILELFFSRSETALSETAAKYGKYCHYIAYNILRDAQDSEECVNDAYLRAWNTIPPQKPNNLATFLGKITRNLALDKYRHRRREKRGGGQTALALDELRECIPSTDDTEQIISDQALVAALNSFLAGLPKKNRQIFLRRYWYLSPICEIAQDFSISESNARVILLRTRNKLKRYLERAGILL